MTLKAQAKAVVAPVKPKPVAPEPLEPALENGTLEKNLSLGRAHRDLGEFDLASTYFAEALHLAKQLGDRQAEVDALNLQGGLASTRGDYLEALAAFEHALSLARELKLEDRQANILNNIGTLHTMLSNYPLALRHLQAAHDILRRVAPHSRSRANNLLSLGALYGELGDVVEARAFFTNAGQVATAAGEPLVVAAALNNLANTDLAAADWEGAAEHFQKALEIARRLGAREYELDNLDGLGQIYVATGDFQRAVTVHHEVLQAARAIGDLEGECDALQNLGRDFLALDQAQRAVDVLLEGLELAAKGQRKTVLYELHELLSRAYAKLADFEHALRHYSLFHKGKEAVFSEENERQARELTVRFDVERNRHEAVEQRLRTEVMRQAKDEAEAQVAERTRELEAAQVEIVTRLAVAAEYRDDNTGEHTRRVGRNAAALALVLGWTEEDAQLLFTAARLHDVGKIAVSDTILHKTGKLSADEMALMRTHAMIGARILAGGHSKLLKLAEEIALAHHERWDGKGYPLGLVGSTIPLSARIVAVADVLDALTHERPYKRPWSTEEALRELQRQSGHHFDPEVVAACVQVFGDAGVLCPTDLVSDWQTTVVSFDEVLLAGVQPYSVEIDTNNQVARLQKLLEERDAELETSKREAQCTANRMQAMAFTDLLTGLPNRRAFEADLELEVARATHQDDPLSILNLDLDMLKAVNDNEGHERGDALLRVFAEIARTQLHKWGKVYRVGGDEFAAILVYTDTSRFEAVQHSLVQVVRDIRAAGFPQAGVSAGLASFPEEVKVASDLIRLSDQRMYEQKLAKRCAASSSH